MADALVDSDPSFDAVTACDVKITTAMMEHMPSILVAALDYWWPMIEKYDGEPRTLQGNEFYCGTATIYRSAEKMRCLLADTISS